ncbi:hypothetical protein [Micromonospora echinofusca]|uniref:Uncharacterized protein n=1 Tax=Micromonospora echinofusca TaxID=47858 RepID=A0ABS3VJH0_MICEH|nr:hypothetical protein [Micromonospora echinofusca]MBO4204659.1 hypothetical protein [Micromonospora echinofusca]
MLVVVNIYVFLVVVVAELAIPLLILAASIALMVLLARIAINPPDGTPSRRWWSVKRLVRLPAEPQPSRWTRDSDVPTIGTQPAVPPTDAHDVRSPRPAAGRSE